MSNRVCALRLFVGMAVLWVGVSARLASAADPKEVFEPRTFQSSSGEKLPYRLLKPLNADPAKAYPLVLFLHGSGERGDDNTITLVHGMSDFASDLNRVRYPCYVLVPQCPKEQRWGTIDWKKEQYEILPEQTEPMKLVLGALEQVQTEFKIDANRLYVTGLSMGGYGTWELVTRYPEKFAAAVPVCGAGDVKQAGKLARLPIWAFHGALDSGVKPERSRELITAIQAAGGKPGYTEYPDVGHDSWVRAYSDPHMMSWLFAQKRP